MKWSWTALAVTLFALGVVAGCGNQNNSVQYNTGATILSISPSVAPAGTPSGTLTNCTNTPTGQTNPCFIIFVLASAANGFNTNTVVEWNGQKLYTTYIDSTDVKAEVPYSLIQKPGTAAVLTYQPQSGTGLNGLSNALSFIIYGAPNPVPTLSSINPSSAAICTSKCTNVAITLSGNNFLPVSQNGGSSVTYTGAATLGIETAITVTSITSTEIKASIPGTYLSAADIAKINVINPPSAICIVNCPDLGGGNTDCQPIQAGSGCVPTTQLFTVGVAAAGAKSTASVLAAAEETPAVSQEGRYVAYTSADSATTQVLLHDTCIGAPSGCVPSSQVVSTGLEGATANGESHNPSISSDGRYVAFSSAATNLVEGAPAGRQVYLRDTCVGAAGSCKPSTILISTDSAGTLTGTESILPSISSSGRFVAFVAVTASLETKSTGAANATSSVNSGLRQVFVRDTCLGATNCTPKTTRITLQPGDVPADSSKPAGPALAGLAKQIALGNGKSSTVFTPTVPVDDRVFLAVPNETK